MGSATVTIDFLFTAALRLSFVPRHYRLHQCSLIRRAPLVQTTREETQEGGLEINH